MQSLTEDQVQGVAPVQVSGASLFARRRLWRVSFAWGGVAYEFAGGLDFALEFGNALFEARDFLPLDEGPVVGPVSEKWGNAFRRMDASLNALGKSVKGGFWETRREVLATRLRNAAGYELPRVSEFKARAL